MGAEGQPQKKSSLWARVAVLSEAPCAFLDWREQPTPRELAKQVLLEHGFSEVAARKWLQRHPPEEAVHAWPQSRPAATRTLARRAT